jgi:moderate conductance mechanosensitive channel
MDNRIQESLAMITPKTYAATRLACLLLGTLLAPAGLSTITWAGTDVAAETTVSVADLEHLAQQIADPQQRDQLLKTLQALIVVAKQSRTDEPSQEKPDLFADQSQGAFFAFGELTQDLAIAGRRVVHSLATIPQILAELSVRLREPATFWFMMAIVQSVVILVILGIGLQLFFSHLESKLRARTLGSELRLWWRKAWLALLIVARAVTPYIALVGLSGVVFSILPVGAIPSGLAALVISTVMLYRFLRAVARVLLAPDAPNTRLLPIDDSTAQRTWTWVARLITLVVVYFLITRTLLTIGVAEEFYQVVRGILIIVVTSVLSVLISRLGGAQRTVAVAPEGQRRRLWPSVWATLRTIWPSIAIAYVWCASLLAILSFHEGVTFMVATSLQMAALIGAGIALLWVSDLLFKHAAARNERIGRYIPGLERRTLRYLKAAWWSSRVLIVLVVLLCLLQVWGVGIDWLMTSPFAAGLLWRLITFFVTVAMVMFVVDLTTFIGQKLVEPTQSGVEFSKKRKTLVPLTAAVIKYGALFVGGLIALHQVGVNITPLLAGVGILSLAVGFGAQTLVKDIINGLFILVEDSIAVGDVVTIRGTGGLVEAVNLRTLRLRDLQGSVHIIPNSQVEMITNMTKDYSYYVLDVGIAYREDTDEVVAALQEIDAEMRADPAFAADMLAPIEILGVDRFTDSAVVVRARLKTKPIKQWNVGREFNRRMKKLFDARGIEIPFPQRTLHWGEPKRGEAAPLQLQIHNLEALTTTAGKGDHPAAARHQGNADAP